MPFKLASLDLHRAAKSKSQVSLTIFSSIRDNSEVNVKQLVDFLIAHNVEIIQWLVAIILLTFVGYLIVSLFRKPDTSSGSGESSEDIRKALKEVLEATKASAPSATTVMAAGPAVVSAGTSSDSGAAAQAAAAAAEAAKLQQQVEALRKELEDKNTNGGVATTDPAKDEKIAELESKLSEYEILEDDIADLSLYKEENEKLKKQLAELSSGGVVEVANEETVAAPATDAEVEKTTSDNFVEDFAAALANPAATEPEVTPAANPDAVPEDLVSEFETVVKTTQVETPPAAATNSLPNPREELASQSADDLMAEFERSMSGDDTAATTDVSLMDLNTDKMLEEMADLAAVPTDANAASALEEGIDTDKMAEEASKLKE